MVELPQCMTEKHPVAMYAHRCCECGGTIEKGEKYQYVTGIWDNYPSTHKTCLDCKALRDELNAGRHWEDQVPFGGIREDLEYLNWPDTETYAVKFKAIQIKRKSVYLCSTCNAFD